MGSALAESLDVALVSAPQPLSEGSIHGTGTDRGLQRRHELVEAVVELGAVGGERQHGDPEHRQDHEVGARQRRALAWPNGGS